jgi:ADP-ribosyl-[dinitrogen reductase] hydrolase
VPRPDPDKVLGSLVGLAVCEALAGSSPGDVSEDAPLSPGLWGDGTAMALSLAESLVENKGMDQRDQMVRYTSWLRYGYLSSTETCDFIDETVKQAILRFERTWNPLDENQTQGDACLARVAPVVVYFAAARDDMLTAVTEATITTHSAPQSLDACRLLAAMMFEALRGAGKEDVLHPALPGNLCPEIANLCAEPAGTVQSSAGRSLQAAVNALRESVTFAEGARQCLSQGPRALAAYGQLAGAWYGQMNIPQAWRSSLVRHNILEQKANQLLNG